MMPNLNAARQLVETHVDVRDLRRTWFALSAAGLLLGLLLLALGRRNAAYAVWIAGTAPVAAAVAWESVRSLRAGKLGVDLIALLSMTAAMALGEALAGSVVSLMYAGGTLLEDFAIRRAERDLTALVDRAPRRAHRRRDDVIEDIAVSEFAIGDRLLVRGGAIVPVDGMVASGDGAVLDEAVLTGEPLPVTRKPGEAVLSGTVNAGETFELEATARADDSAYAGVVRLVAAAQTGMAGFIRMADRFALLLLPVTIALAGAAWAWSGDPVRALAVLVAATPCPLILAAPTAFISGVTRAARRGILVKGCAPLEALADAHTVLFDKTGTLTVGGARLVAIEAAPGIRADDVLQVAASLDQVSPHIVAAAIVKAARDKALTMSTPTGTRAANIERAKDLLGVTPPTDDATSADANAARRSI